MKVENLNSSVFRPLQQNALGDNSIDDDTMILCRKIEFMLNAMAIHISHFFSITENYVSQLANVETLNVSNKRDLFRLISVKDDYAYCVNSIRTLLRNDGNDLVKSIPGCLMDCYKHELSLKVARDINSAKKYLKLLEMYSAPSRKYLIAKKWRHAMNELKNLDYLVSV
ncbi:hypothetical protein [Methylomonas rapida]|uniref:Uncharacterized protein n=1 Tax=Methylomonas rapida TaxID=2963939 RepID=A0ABY7GJ10_9GAMM|nr:hypothetical protein [Methylomonas rapida]WAR44611.1 hypothetical protein NM686_020040 [Methylomonas rapida]